MLLFSFARKTIRNLEMDHPGGAHVEAAAASNVGTSPIWPCLAIARAAARQ
jgi:hypothetical protein